MADDQAQTPMARLVHAMLGESVRIGASEVHIEPRQDRVAVRYRIGDSFVERDPIPMRMRKSLAAQLKEMAEMDPLKDAEPQEGSTTRKVDGVEYPFRFRTTLSTHGEAFVIRIGPPGSLV